MATVTQVMRTCDVCGSTEDVKTRTFVLDGKAYEIDLCRKDGDALGEVAARYIASARKVTARPDRRQRGGRPRRRAANASTPAARAAGLRQRKGIYVYGILPADIEVAAGVPGVGADPGPLRDVRRNGLAALISDVDLSDQLGSPDDLRTYREILDATAAEVPVLPLRFGTILASEDAVVDELLAANHDKFIAALDRVEGRTEFQVTGRYVDDTSAASREEDTQALERVMAGVSVAVVAPEPGDEPDAVHVAFLVDVGQEREVERVIEDLAHEWKGRVDLQLLGPMAAYDFTQA